ncbi:DHH family phosphoesterase [Bacillus testis]|uniref:DHH family phosphoesterase n=1 Tax=Bacillus testis TaxID=1622072 RepID=UPI00067F5C32|nr:oligoribonuclease [Bacillus testis]
MYTLLTHTDLDGVGCGILAKLAFDQKVKVRYNSIASLNHEIEFFLENGSKDTFLFITDLSPNTENEAKLNEFYSKNGNVQLIDHHKTALHLNDYEWGYVLTEDDQGQLASATSLFFHYLVDRGLLAATDAIAEFVEMVRQYDTWEWEKNGNRQAHQLNSLFFLVSIDEFEEMMIRRLQTSDHFDFDDFEKKLLRMEEEKIERYIRRKKRELVQKEIEGRLAGVVFAESYHSELGNELGKEYEQLDYIAIVNIGGKKIAFRTIHDYMDVSAVAGQFGGGGHEKASGCSLSADAYHLFVEGTFHLEPLREDAKRNRFNVKKSSFGTLYTNHKKDIILLTPLSEGSWGIEKNKEEVGDIFLSFHEGERYLKRAFTAWLARDEQFVDYLMKEAKK